MPTHSQRTPKTDLQKLIEGIENNFQNEFEYITTQYGYGLEQGLSREQVIVSFLRKHMPANLYFGPGIVISKTGAMSLPQDIVIFNHLNYPMFPLGESGRLFPCEGVEGVIQIKSKANEKNVEDSVENLASAKKLVANSGNRAIGALISFSGPTKPSTLNNYLTKHNKVYAQPYLAIDRAYILQKYVLFYLDSTGKAELRAQDQQVLGGLVTKKSTLLHFMRYLFSSLTYPTEGINSMRDYVDPFFAAANFQAV